jgi:DNA-binding CsgD family transcriptional regulator
LESRVSDGALVRLVGSLYEVALSPARWQEWLSELCDALAVPVGVLVLGFEANVGDQCVFVAGLPDPTAEDPTASAPSPFYPQPRPRAPYLQYLAEDSRLFDKALALAEGELLILSEVLPEEEFTTTRFFREWLQPRRLYHVVSLIVSRKPRSISGLSLLRRPAERAFAQAELDLLRRLLPHLQRVVQIQEMAVDAALKYQVAQSLLEALRCGAVFVDGSGRVCGANAVAASLIERGEGVRLEGAELRAEDPRETSALRRVVRGAAGGSGCAAGGVLALSRRGRRHALVVSASPLKHRDAHGPWLPAAKALVLLSDPQDLPALHEPALRQLYGLTQAEARVASRIASGDTVDEIAAALGVRPATVRTQLQQALEKTGTHRQADLVRLLLMADRGLAQLS